MPLFTDDEIDVPYLLSRKNPCVIIIDCRSKAITEQQADLNRWLRDFSEEAERMLTREIDRSYVDARIITVGNTIEVGGAFLNASEGLPELQLKYGTGASLEEAMEIALNLLEERKHQYQWAGLIYNNPKLYILSADIVNYCASIAETENRIHCMIRDNKIKFYPIVCLPKFLMDAGERHLRDACLPTLQAPLELSMFVTEDYWSLPMAHLFDNEDGSLFDPPLPSTITSGL